MLNVNRLRILIEVANRGSFSAAADALSYTQSAVSQQVAALEAENGVTLLERLRRGAVVAVRRRRLGAGLRGGGGEPEEIAPRLSAGEFDLALLFEFDGTSESLGPDMVRVPLFEDPMFLALPA